MLYLLALFSLARAQLWWNATNCHPELTNRGVTKDVETFSLSLPQQEDTTFEINVYYPDESDQAGNIPAIAILPDEGIPPEDYEFRAMQLAQNGFLAYVIDYYGDLNPDDGLLTNEEYLTKVVKGSLKHMADLRSEYGIQTKQSVIGFGFGGQVAWSIEYTDWWANQNLGIASGAAVGAETMDTVLIEEAFPATFPFFSSFTENANAKEWRMAAAEVFNGSQALYSWGLSCYADATPGFANYGTEEYRPCPGELAFSDALQFITRVLGENHESFGDNAAVSSQSTGGLNPSDLAPKGALIALGVLCGLVLLCILCYSYYPEDFSEISG